MKTSIKKILAFALLSIALSASALTSSAADKGIESPVLLTTIPFNKLVIKGNIKVVLVQHNKPRVDFDEDYNKEAVSVVQKGDKLYLTSYQKEPVNVVVYMVDLQRIDVSNTSSVSTRGKISVKVLQIFLKDEASAYVNGEIESLYTVTKDKSKLSLKGSSADHMLVKSKISKLKMDHFLALKTTSSILDDAVSPLALKTTAVGDSLMADRVIK